MTHGCGVRRWPCALLALASAVSAGVATRSSAGGVSPSGCTSIAGIPVAQSIQYGAAIQSIFVNFNGQANGCADCHTAAMGASVPSGYLDLDPLDFPSPYVNLVNVESPMYPGNVYVVPNHPERSFLFQKINCDFSAGGERMPLGNYGGGLSPELQALIYDWIAAGAPVGTTDAIFRGTFDVRGFDQ